MGCIGRDGNVVMTENDVNKEWIMRDNSTKLSVNEYLVNVAGEDID